MKELSLHVLDLMENSVSAKASKIELTIRESLSANRYAFTITDNGKGMSVDFLARVTDPYTTTRTTRKVGLGLPLIKMNTENAGGGMDIKSILGKGTELNFWFEHNHWDRPPLGDIAGTVVMLAAQHEDIHFVYKHITDSDQYTFDTAEVREALEGMSINEYTIIKYLRDMINENLSAIGVTQ